MLYELILFILWIEEDARIHGFALGLLVDLEENYSITSNRESGFGRYDVMLEPKDKTGNAFVLEFKIFESMDLPFRGRRFLLGHKLIYGEIAWKIEVREYLWLFYETDFVFHFEFHLPVVTQIDWKICH